MSRKTAAVSKQKAQARLDNWMNVITGLGSSERDKTKQATWIRDPALDPELLSGMFSGSDLSRRVVSALVDEAMRQGFTVEVDGDDDDEAGDHERGEELMLACEGFSLRAKVHEGAVWGRLLGGGGLWLGVDGPKQAQPLDDNLVKPGQLKFITTIDRRDLTWSDSYTDELSPKYGEPARYRVNLSTSSPAMTTAGADVHESRLVMFPGTLTTKRQRRENSGWDHSVLQPIYEVIRAADANWQSVCHLMTDFGQGVFKIKGLMDMVAAGQEETVRTRMELVDMGRSVVRALMLDAELEDFERKATPTAGISELLIQTWQRLAAAADMPVTVLMGMSPAGLNATGASDTRMWYDRVQHYRETVLTPRLNRLVRLVARHLGYKDADKWHVCWPSLWQMTAPEEAALRKTVAETDKIYFDIGALIPEEIAIERSKNETARVSFPVIDMKVRQAMLDKELSAAEERAGEPDQGVPPSGANPAAAANNQPSSDDEQGDTP